MSKNLTSEQLGKLVALLAENGYAVIPLAAFQGARPVQSAPVQAPTPTVEAAPVETATSERKCSYCGESGHNVRTCPKKAKPSAPAPAPVQAPTAPAPALPSLPSFDLDLSDLGSVGVPEVVATPAPAPAPVKAPAPKAKPTPAPVASKSEIDSELDALFNF